MIGVSLGSSILGLCVSWTWMFVSFTRLGTFSVIISLNRFSVFYCWDPYNANVNRLDVVPEAPSTHLISQNSFFFLLFWLFPLPCLPYRWSILLHHLIHYWILLLYYSLQLFRFSVLFGTLCLLSLFKFCVHPYFSWVWWPFLWALFWTLYLVDCLSLFCFFFWCLSYSFFWNIFLSPHFP